MTRTCTYRRSTTLSFEILVVESSVIEREGMLVTFALVTFNDKND